jgi:hypothetical protein
MFFCDRCNFVGNTTRKFYGHLSTCKHKINQGNVNENCKNLNINQNLNNSIYENENLDNSEYFSDNECANAIKANENYIFEEDHHLFEYVKFQKDLIDNNIIDRLHTGRVKLIDGSYSQEASINNYLEISNFGKYV